MTPTWGFNYSFGEGASIEEGGDVNGIVLPSTSLSVLDVDGVSMRSDESSSVENSNSAGGAVMKLSLRTDSPVFPYDFENESNIE